MSSVLTHKDLRFKYILYIQGVGNGHVVGGQTQLYKIKENLTPPYCKIPIPALVQELYPCYKTWE